MIEDELPEHHTQWFGESWGAPVCMDVNHVKVPIGQTCLHCHQPILADSQGLMIFNVSMASPGETSGYKPWHVDCFLSTITTEEVIASATKAKKSRGRMV